MYDLMLCKKFVSWNFNVGLTRLNHKFIIKIVLKPVKIKILTLMW